MFLSHAVYRENYKVVNVKTCRRALDSENAVSTISVRLVPEILEQGIERTTLAVKTVDKWSLLSFHSILCAV